MTCRQINRISRGLYTRFSSPCRILYTNWDEFNKNNKEENDKPKRQSK